MLLLDLHPCYCSTYIHVIARPTSMLLHRLTSNQPPIFWQEGSPMIVSLVWLSWTELKKIHRTDECGLETGFYAYLSIYTSLKFEGVVVLEMCTIGIFSHTSDTVFPASEECSHERIQRRVICVNIFSQFDSIYHQTSRDVCRRCRIGFRWARRSFF